MASALFAVTTGSTAFAIDGEWVWQEFEENCVAPIVRGEPAPLDGWTEIRNFSTPSGVVVERHYDHEGAGINYLFTKQPGEHVRCGLSGFEEETRRELAQWFPPVMLGQHYVNLPANSNEALLYHGLATQCGDLGYGPRLLVMLFQIPMATPKPTEAPTYLLVSEIPDDGQNTISCGDS